MRYEKGHKELTRKRIIETAAARFRRDGIEAVGVADLMAEAGLTVGGFYSHFDSKEDLVRAAMDEAARRARDRFQQRIEDGGLENWIRMYMRLEHRDHPESGCAAAALASELSRHPGTSRKGFTDNFVHLQKSIEAHLPVGMKSAMKRKTATGIFATLIGAIQLARAVNDSALSEQILEAGIASALTLAQIKPSAS